MSSGSTRAAKSGRLSTNSLIRASNFAVPNIHTLWPKLRRVPQIAVYSHGLRLQWLVVRQQHAQLLTV
jgi:hypothetical protein